ncbi:MAG TPA: NADH-quinone oxidoreductase subunit J [Caldithrix abyssi]|uniref:NADH-quinone oxidoreductase subunit J n=1 Tax=Caldithrix abyssi TaxID=187145 RepID=A0A7V4WWD8_CALAY|nr:NADH-quinone oxidoreductase subunit J [Caldithrix abyssi]
MEAKELLFLFIAIVTIASAGLVAFSNKLIHSAFALMATFVGFAALYVFLSADFLAVTQIVVYVGGILILILFGVMMTHRIYDTTLKTIHNPLAMGIISAAALAVILGLVIYRSPWAATVDKPFVPTTSIIGAEILTNYLLPFELVSVLLLGVLIGAVFLARTEEHKK